MTDKEASQSEGTASESHEFDSGEGPSFGEGGMSPGGSEMESWKKGNPSEGDAEESLQEQGENLRDRLDKS